MTDNRDYYDAFAPRYDHGRDKGYHKLIDDQAVELVRRVGEGKDLLEVGCGTGLLLARTSQFARTARGIDLSPGMLAHARQRGLTVEEASADQLPFPSASFDVVYSFKVLSHLPDLRRVFAEMDRVLRPGGSLVFDLYNRRSLRWLVKRGFGPRPTSDRYDESAIATHYYRREAVAELMPAGLRLRSVAGIRVFTPHPVLLRIPGLARGVRALEWRSMDSGLAKFAGFLVFTWDKP